MALEAALEQLCSQLLALHETCTNLRTTVWEDKPLQDDVVLVDLFGNAVDDLLGLIEEALAAARDSRQAAGSSFTLQQAGHALLICHDRHTQTSHRYSADLLSYERIRELRRFGRRRGGEWGAWSRGVKVALDSCRQPLFDVDDALLRCWGELIEKTGGATFHVQ
ncbi:MAG: hypothetical protein JOZ51_11670, partial [Chloroflexi bacterium]|nr:hypothetical protein [Chloroflexota bacterium]